MHYLPNGKQVFDNVEELTYNFLTAMELSVLPDGSVVDFTTPYAMAAAPNGCGIMAPTSITCSGKTLKATVDPDNVKYAGESEVMLDILNNVKQVDFLLGYLLKKIEAQNEDQFLSYYAMEGEDPNGVKVVSMNAKFMGREVCSEFYYNKCLAFVGLVFELTENDVDLSNFNILEIKKK